MGYVFAFLAGAFAGLVVGMFVQWAIDLPREYRR